MLATHDPARHAARHAAAAHHAAAIAHTTAGLDAARPADRAPLRFRLCPLPPVRPDRAHPPRRAGRARDARGRFLPRA